MQPKHIGILVAVLAILAGLWFTVGGGKKAKDGDKAASAAQKDGENPGGDGKAPLVKAEEGLSDKAEAKPEQLALPGALPALKNVQAGGTDAPAQPHGKVEVEGDVQEADAEAAIKAVFPALRDCYAELKKIAPQAGGRMLTTSAAPG